MRINIVVLASGRGSDFQSIVDGVEKGEVDAKIVALLTDNPNANAIERARKNNIPWYVLEKPYDGDLRGRLEEVKPDLVVLAGYMRVIHDKELLREWKGKIINIHPSLLPKYAGLEAQKKAWEAGEKISGYTIHLVDESLDGGAIIYQEEVGIGDCKSWEEAAKKILAREHVGLPKIVDSFAKGRWIIEGKKARYEIYG